METRCVKTLRPRLETKPESQLERENKPSPSCCGLLSSCRAFPLPSLGPRLPRMSGVSSCSTPARKKFSPPLSPPNLTPPVRHPNQSLSLQKRHAGELTQGNRSPWLRPWLNRLEPLLLPTPPAREELHQQINQPRDFSSRAARAGTGSRGKERCWRLGTKGAARIPSAAPPDRTSLPPCESALKINSFPVVAAPPFSPLSLPIQ